MKRLALVVSVVAVAGGAAFFWVQSRITAPYRGFSTPEVFVELPPGSSVPSIADRLAANGVVADP